MSSQLTLIKAFETALVRKQQPMSTVPSYRGGWRRILESFSGAWQQNVVVTQADLSCYPTVYACIMRKASDIGKLPFCLKQDDGNGICKSVENSSYSPVLRKPNDYQTAQQFRENWLVSKMFQGNTYGLKHRDNSEKVRSIYILDPCRVQPMVTESGAVYYQLQTDPLNSLPVGYPAENLIVPATEIIHDRCITIHHPLVGVPPLCAAYWPAVKNLKILKSSAEFFANNAQPGGILTAPAGMSDDDALKVKEFWQKEYSGNNAGKVAVIGADMKFVSFQMNGADSQLVEQMQYSDRQICQPFGIPPFIVGVGEIPAGMKVDDVMNMYYSLALQSDIEAMEYLLDEGLGISKPLGVELDLEPLLRMDVSKQAEVESKLVGGKIKTPDEARRKFNLPPTGGGSSLWGQQQDYPLGMLADRADWDPNMQKTAPKSDAPQSNDGMPSEDDEEATKAMLSTIERSIEKAMPDFESIVGMTDFDHIRCIAGAA